MLCISIHLGFYAGVRIITVENNLKQNRRAKKHTDTISKYKHNRFIDLK